MYASQNIKMNFNKQYLQIVFTGKSTKLKARPQKGSCTSMFSAEIFMKTLSKLNTDANLCLWTAKQISKIHKIRNFGGDLL